MPWELVLCAVAFGFSMAVLWGCGRRKRQPTFEAYMVNFGNGPELYVNEPTLAKIKEVMDKYRQQYAHPLTGVFHNCDFNIRELSFPEINVPDEILGVRTRLMMSYGLPIHLYQSPGMVGLSYPTDLLEGEEDEDTSTEDGADRADVEEVQIDPSGGSGSAATGSSGGSAPDGA